MSEHFDLGDAARFLNIDHDEILQLIDSGKLPARRLAHGGWTVEKDAVLEYAKERDGNR